MVTHCHKHMVLSAVSVVPEAFLGQPLLSSRATGQSHDDWPVGRLVNNFVRGELLFSSRDRASLEKAPVAQRCHPVLNLELQNDSQEL